MKIICELNDKIILGQSDGKSNKKPRTTARAIVRSNAGLYAVMHSVKFGLYSLPGGGVEKDEDVTTALCREIMEEVGCTCDKVEELGIIHENRASLDYTQINYYYVVYTENIGQNNLTDAERNNKTLLEWHTFDNMFALISNQQMDTIQRKYLQARDVAALIEFKACSSNSNL